MAREEIDLTLSDDDEEILNEARSEFLLKSWGARPQPAKVKPAGSSGIPPNSAVVGTSSTPVPLLGQVPRPLNGYHNAVQPSQDQDKKPTTRSTGPLRELAPQPSIEAGALPLAGPASSQRPTRSPATQPAAKQHFSRPTGRATVGSGSSTFEVASALSANVPTVQPSSCNIAFAASQPSPRSFGAAWNGPGSTLATKGAPIPLANLPAVTPPLRNVAMHNEFHAATGAQHSVNADKTMVTPQLYTFPTSLTSSMPTTPQGQSSLQPYSHGESVPVRWPGAMTPANLTGPANPGTKPQALSSQYRTPATITQSVIPQGTARPPLSETLGSYPRTRDATIAETREILDPYFDCPVAQEMLANPMPAASLFRMRKIFVTHPATRTDMIAFLAKLGISKPGQAQAQTKTQSQAQTHAQASPQPQPKAQAQAQTTNTPLPPPQGRVNQATKFVLYTPPQHAQGSVAQASRPLPHTRQAPTVFRVPPTTTQMEVVVTPKSSDFVQVPIQTTQPQPAPSQAKRAQSQGFKRSADGNVKPPENISKPSYESTYYSKEGISAASRLAQYGSDLTTQSRNVSHPGPLDTFVPKDLDSRNTTKDNRVRYLHSFITRNSDISVQDQWKCTPEEDELVDLLKQYVGLTWAELGKHFPYRTSWHPLQHRYSERTIAKRARAETANNSVPKLLQKSAHSHEQNSVLGSTTMRNTKMLASRVKTMSTDDESYSDANLTRKRSKRAAAEAASKKGFAITRESFYGHTSDSEHSEIVTDTSRVSARNHYVTCLEHEILIERHRFEDEHARDSAAVAGLLEKISRCPLISIQAHTKRKTLRKRQSTEILRPYLTKSERDYVGTSNLAECDLTDTAWCGKALHVDFNDIEVGILEPCMTQVMLPHTPATSTQRDRSLRQWVSEVMSTANSADVTGIYQRYLNSGMNMPGRSRISIESYLEDLAAEQTTDLPLAKRIDIAKPSSSSQSKVSSSLRQRELGLAPHLSSLKPAMLNTTFGPSHVFKKASSDVTNVAWAPNGVTFAVGSAALMDNHSMQYNRRNNLLLGDATAGSLQELPHHAIKRATSSGVNASQAMSMSQDQLLYTTVSAVKFAPNGTTLFTAGYDNVARIWDVKNGLPHLRLPQFRHRSALELLEVNANGTFFATGSRKAERSIQVLRTAVNLPEQTHVVSVFESSKAKKYPEWQIMPSVLRWGPASMGQEKYLVAGFSSTLRDSGGQGQTCIWDIEAQEPLLAETGSGSVFDIAWSPNIFGRLAIAGSPSGSVNKGTNSVARIMDSYRLNQKSRLHVKPQHVVELECPAVDVNDIIFNSKDNNLITTGCTDGRVYLWDLRRPDNILHCFSHGKTLVELDQTSGQTAESLDTGIRFVSWDEGGRKLFSGSSDGVVALWDPYVAPEDAHVRNIVQLGSGVMSGAFSPDFSNLLLGEEDGTVTMLTVGTEVDSCEPLKYNRIEKFTYKEAEQEDFDSLYEFLKIDNIPDDTEADPGIKAAQAKLYTQEMKMAPLSGFPRGQAVQGHNYRGPYNNDPDADLLRHQSRRFQWQRRHRPGYECKFEHEISFITEEERGDDGTSKLRIPAHIRTHADAKVVCFRCNNVVLTAMSLLPDDDILGCHDCCMAWRLDVLGYTQVDYYTDETLPQVEFKDLEAMTARLTLGQIVEDDHAAQEVEGWAHGFWGTADEDE